MKRKPYDIRWIVAWVLLALLGQTTRGQNWVPAAEPIPAWVLESLSVSVSGNAASTQLRYQADMPDPAHRLGLAEAPTLDGSEIRCTLRLEYLEGAAAIQVITPVSGALDLGTLEPGAYTVVVLANGQEVKRLPIQVQSAEPYLSEPQDGKPYIENIELSGKEVIVHVAVPDGVRKVTLESRSRVGAGAWTPRAVERVTGAGSLTVRLARSEQLEMLRIRGDAQEPLPANFYRGQTNFNGQIGSYGGNVPEAYYPGVDVKAPTADDSRDATRAVTESDIWSIRGDTLYFFNQYRGLQIVDLTQPDAPVMRARLDMPAAGEQMYVLDDQYVVLLVRENSSSTGQAIVVDVAGEPKIVAKMAVEGDISNKETRMVGSALYLTSQTYKEITLPPKPGSEDRPVTRWEWGSVVSSFDLVSPASPVKRDTLWFTGYGNAITATDEYLLVSHRDDYSYNSSTIEIVDISAPDGSMKTLGKVQTVGVVADKFKMHVYSQAEGGDVLAAISEVWGDNTRRKSVLQTFSLADPANPAKLGYLEVGHGEGLYATRFDGDRAYLVTFLRIDPLWIVDMKDPSAPKLLGELEVPGWSTYMQPLGDRLVTIGIDNSNNWRVAVSLFDVADPAKPSLLSKVLLGEQGSWSEANYDEKAFTVLPDAGTILVPYQGWSSNDWASAVQIIDLGRDTLRARGRIDHSMQPRRADVLNDRIVSISGRDLLVVNAEDRDRPVTTASLELSWAVNRVFVAGDYLLEIEDSAYWAPDSRPNLRVVRQTGPDLSVAKYEFTNGVPIVGACQRDGKLYVLQGQAQYYYAYLKDGSVDPTESKSETKLYLTVFNASALPQLLPVGQTEWVDEESAYLSGLTAVWPRPGLLVWSGAGGGGRWWGPLYLDAFAPTGRSIWWGGGSAGRLIACDVASASAPKFLSDLNLSSTNGWWNFSPAYTAGGLVYLSHQASEYIPDVLPPGQRPPEPEVTKRDDGTLETNIPPYGVWISRNYLDVVDYTDPANPTVRKPVSLPAALVGVSAEGALVYTKGQHWDDSYQSDYADYLDALAYDGVSASLVASAKLATNAWASLQPSMLADGTLLVPVNDYTGSNTLGTVQAWKLGAEGRLANLWNRRFGEAISNVRVWTTLMAAQLNQKIELYDIADPAQWAPLGTGASAGYVWPDLTNADADIAAGLFVPLGDYGVWGVPVKRP